MALFDQTLFVKITLAAVITGALAADFALFLEYASFPEKILIQDITPYEKRFEELKEILPRQGVAGYVSDCETGNQNCLARFFVAQYALSPLLLEQSIDHEFIVGNFSTGGIHTELYRTSCIKAIRDFHNGVVLLRRGSY